MEALIMCCRESLTPDEARAVGKLGIKCRVGERPADVKPYVFRFRSPDHDFSIELRFRRAEVSNKEVIEALHITIANLL